MSNRNAQELLDIYGLSEPELNLIKDFNGSVTKHLPQLIKSSYQWLINHPEYEEFFHDEQT